MTDEVFQRKPWPHVAKVTHITKLKNGAVVLELVLSFQIAEKDVVDLNEASKREENVHILQRNKFPRAATGTHRGTHRNSISRKTNQCSHCNGAHESSACFQKNAKCYSCGRKGHVCRACRNKEGFENSEHPQGTHHMRDETFHETGSADEGKTLSPICTMLPTPPYETEVIVNGKPLQMEIDTCASIIGHEIYKSIGGESGRPTLGKSSVISQTYTWET